MSAAVAGLIALAISAWMRSPRRREGIGSVREFPRTLDRVSGRPDRLRAVRHRLRSQSDPKQTPGRCHRDPTGRSTAVSRGDRARVARTMDLPEGTHRAQRVGRGGGSPGASGGGGRHRNRCRRGRHTPLFRSGHEDAVVENVLVSAFNEGASREARALRRLSLEEALATLTSEDSPALLRRAARR